MKQLNPAWVQTLASMGNACPFFQLLSMDIKELSWGRSHLAIDLASKHHQPFGIVHGGVMASLIDAAGWWAAYSQLEPGLGLTTVEMKLNYLAPAISGQALGQGQVLKMGRSLALAQAQVTDPKGNLLAHGTVTLMVLPQLRVPGQDGLPPKFLD